MKRGRMKDLEESSLGELSLIKEISPRERFEFGNNWRRFLAVLDDDRIRQAELSLEEMLGTHGVEGRSFLDVGCGSGLFSLAAMRLGASRVHSFDFDPQSVASAAELRRRYLPQAASWVVEEGDVLAEDYLRALGQWDVVYAWGVLHHTGHMWRAFENVMPLVVPGGTLFISIYNDQGATSRRWRNVKSLYNKGVLGKTAVTSVIVSFFVLRGLIADILRLRDPIARYREYRKTRGMSLFHDWIDWMGGFPFEVARPEEIFDYFYRRGFALSGLKCCGGSWGCNEFVFKKRQDFG
jgi:2-polyprenyl-6-hydroxyphenyl methylase/3-demethylubiquinone-9 3-methyltransferase